MSKTGMLLGMNIPYVQAHHVGPKQKPTAIVLKTSYTTDDAGAANAIAQAWNKPYNKVDSCHYVIDNFQVLRCVPDNFEAKPANSYIHKNAIVINLCYDPPNGPSRQVMSKAVEQVTRLCGLYGIRPRVLDADQKTDWLHHPRRGRGGIILETVGDFSVDEFVSCVEDHHSRL